MAVTPTSPDVLNDRLKEQDGRPLTIEEKRHHVKSDVADRCSMEGGAWGVANLSNPVSYTHLTLPTICSV